MTLGVAPLVAFLVGIVVGWMLRAIPDGEQETPGFMPHFLVCGNCQRVVPVTVGGACGVCGSETLSRSGRAPWQRKRRTLLKPIPPRLS